MNLVQRVQDILLRPRETFTAIEAEPADTASLYKNYLLILAAIPALAGFIGMSLVGMGFLGIHIPITAGVVHMVLNYVLSLAMIYVVALIADALAPNFGGVRDRMQALKLVAYGSTAALVGGVFSIIPSLSVLGLLAAAYSIYLIYIGAPILMKCPPDRNAGYVAVVCVAAIVAGVVIASVSSLALRGVGMGLWMGGHHGPSVTMDTPEGKVTVDTAKLEELGKKMEAAKAAAEAATPAAPAAEKGGAFPSQELKPLLPEAIGDFKRESIEAMGDGQQAISMATATYRNADKELRMSITDVGGGDLGAAAAMWTALSIDRDTATETEKVYRQGSRSVHEKVHKDGSAAEYSLVLANGVMVGGEGHQGVDLATVKAAVTGIDAARIEGMKRPPAPHKN